MKLVPLRVIFLISLLLFTFFLSVHAETAATWRVQSIDVNGGGFDGGSGCCPVLVDSNNNVHIVYTRYDSDDNYVVIYASSNGSTWSTQTIAPGLSYSLALDNKGNPHVVYWWGNLMYASWTGTNWTIQTIDSGSYGCGVVSLDSFGNPHVAYTDGETVKYASWTGTNWTIQTIGTYDSVTYQISLAFNSNNTPYVFFNTPTTDYGSNNHDNLELATYQNSRWTIQNITAADGYGNMVLDSEGNPDFIYAIREPGTPFLDNSTLFYDNWNGTNWSTQTVISNVSLSSNLENGNDAFLALDSLNYPHIAYVTRTPEIIYASCTGKAWDIQDTPIAPSWSCYLALDSNSNPHISYFYQPPNEDRESNLMYATTNETTPIFTPSPESTSSTPSPTQSSQPEVSSLPLFGVLTAFFIAAIITLVYVFRKRRQL